MASAARHGVKDVAQGAFEGASGEASIGFHVACGGFDGAALAGDVDGRPFGTVAAVSSVNERPATAIAGEDFDLFEGLAVNRHLSVTPYRRPKLTPLELSSPGAA